MSEKWIWIPNWDGPEGFQHYKGRDPIWIKNYTRLLSHDGYLSLSLPQRGLLHGIWIAYAKSARRLPGDTLTISRRLGQRVRKDSLVSLSAAGFIEFVASDVLAARLHDASPEKNREEKIRPGGSSRPNGSKPVHVWQEGDKPPDLTYITGGAA